jgi:pyruvate/2-oxoacid:ferredoxin oxidoreductase alpha subunit
MNDKRFKKLDTFVQQEFTKDFYGYEIINPEAKIFFVTFGMNRIVLEQYIREKNKKNVKYGLIVLKVFQPLDMRLKEFLDTHVKQIKKIVFVEMNYSGQIQELITNKCLLHDKKWNNKITSIRKYTSYPIFAEDIVL